MAPFMAKAVPATDCLDVAYAIVQRQFPEPWPLKTRLVLGDTVVGAVSGTVIDTVAGTVVNGPTTIDVTIPHVYNGPKPVSPQGSYNNAALNSSLPSVKEESPGLEPISLSQGKSRRRLYMLIAISVLVLVGAAAGGVVGGLSRRNRDASSEASTAVPDPTTKPTLGGSISLSTTTTPTPTATLQSLRPNSRLAVTGWRVDMGFNIRLFYQDRKDNIRFSDYSSDEGSWSSPNKVAATDVMPGTPIGAGTYLVFDPAQIELFWFNTSSELAGSNFRDGYTPFSGSWDSVDENPVDVNEESRLAMYWPYAVVQNGDSSLRQVTYPWTNNTLGISGSRGTGMAIVPWTSTCASPCTAALVYRASDGRLAGYFVQQNLPGLVWDFETILADTSNTIPEETAIAAFAVAKQNDANNGTNVYVLYQNGDNDIELLAYNDATWEGNTTALKGADAGTDIACVTEAVLETINVMTSQYDMSRCYFLSGGHIREVLYNGTGWEELGNIPLS
ncbi:hypothetical protein F4818DRAFT_446141 [Hypoxylon cercidicola]|nr:hypothetical protein F4818DRAFT_446141 [Hypoxylon cercidicola]